MAPEVIRNEACSEKVDIYSYGVVLWELLTCEQPYKNFDQNSIMWGVGSNKLRLPIPSSAPEGIKLLLKLCFNVKPRNRPSFGQIIKHLDVISTTDMLIMNELEFSKNQQTWKHEISEKMNMKHINEDNLVYHFEDDLVEKRKEELKHATDIRELYEKKLEKANNLYFELNTVLLQLDEREKELIKREKAVNIHNKRLVRPILKREFKNRAQSYIQKNKSNNNETNDSNNFNSSKQEQIVTSTPLKAPTTNNVTNEINNQTLINITNQSINDNSNFVKKYTRSVSMPDITKINSKNNNFTFKTEKENENDSGQAVVKPVLVKQEEQQPNQSLNYFKHNPKNIKSNSFRMTEIRRSSRAYSSFNFHHNLNNNNHNSSNANISSSLGFKSKLLFKNFRKIKKKYKRIINKKLFAIISNELFKMQKV